MFSISALLLLALGVSLLVGRLLMVGRRPKGLPPGPPTIPVLGNMHQMPKRDAHKQFQRWAHEYGPIYSLMLGTKMFIVLSSDEAVKELLDKRSAIYSDRLDMYIGQTLCSGGLRFLMMHYGPTWRMIRKMMHNILNISAAKSYVPYQSLENKQMLYEMLTQPDRFLDNIRRYSNSLSTSMVFGWRTVTHDDPKLIQLYKGFNEFTVINQTGTAKFIDFFPVLRLLPDFVLPTRRRAKELHRVEKELYSSHWLNCKQAIKDGTAKPSFCADMARVQEEQGLSDDQAAYISGTLLTAGSDPTSNTLYGFVQAMLLFPDVQRKAQEEIDRVVGRDRLPDMDDEPKMQYIRGAIKESLRWMPTTLLGAVPHAVMRDDEYMGYRIPKGAGVLNNVYTINMDPVRHPEPRRFDPDRYKDDFLSLADSAIIPDVTKRDQFTFGAGRRICQGMYVAERSLFLGISRLLWGFDITPAKDASGNDILPDSEKLTQGFVCMPEPYQAVIKPRSPQKAELIKRFWEEAQTELDPKTKQWKKIPKGMAFVGGDKT